MPGTVIRSEMPSTPLRRTSSAISNALVIGVSADATLRSLSFEMQIEGVDALGEPSDPGLGLLGARDPLERERARDDGRRQDAGLLGHARRSPGPRRSRCLRPSPR